MNNSKNPALSISLDNNKPYILVASNFYLALAFINLIFPFVILILAYKESIFDVSTRFTIAFIIVFILMTTSMFLSCKLWLARRRIMIKAQYKDNSTIAILILADFSRTCGTWFALILGIFGTSAILTASIFLNQYDFVEIFRSMGIKFIDNEVDAFLALPIAIFMSIMLGKFFSECLIILKRQADFLDSTGIHKAEIHNQPENSVDLDQFD